MTQAERDRLVALKKAKKKLITQKQAAEELGITERHVRRLLRALKRRGDKAVVHALRGLPSNRTISADSRQAKKQFEKKNPGPSTGRTSGGCPGYVVGHVIPLKRVGVDAPSNMTWQTRAEAKAKDRVE